MIYLTTSPLYRSFLKAVAKLPVPDLHMKPKASTKPPK